MPKEFSANSTVFRVFKILQWLIEGPQTVESINQRFMDEAEVGRRVSDDSIWLYINTLKALGCEIGRPTESNGYRYILHYHPFSSQLTEADVIGIAQAKTTAERYLSYEEMLTFDAFLKRLLEASYSENRKQLGKMLFASSRSVDYGDKQLLLQQISDAIRHKTVLFIDYQSPVKGEDSFYFLPESLRYQNGCLYLLGSRLGRDSLVMLRVEKIKQIEPVAEPDIETPLTALTATVETIEVLFPGLEPRQLEPLQMNEVVTEIPNVGTSVTIHTRDSFLLKQKLLETGLPFQILSPQSFRAELLETLVSTKRLYERRG